MNCLLLAAGLGTRLRPLTNNIPKCLVPIDGKPCIVWVTEWLSAQGIDQIVVNTHYKADKVQNTLGTDFLYLHEPQLLGTAGTVRACAKYMGDTFLVMNADTLVSCDLMAMGKWHTECGNNATFLFHHQSLMKEEPQMRCAGVMLFERDYALTLPKTGMIDDIVTAAKFVKEDTKYLDIGSPEKYELAQSAVHEIYAKQIV